MINFITLPNIVYFNTIIAYSDVANMNLIVLHKLCSSHVCIQSREEHARGLHTRTLSDHEINQSMAPWPDIHGLSVTIITDLV